MITYHVYILYSEKLQQYYVGQTEDIEQRLIRHNSGHGKHTKKGVPWILVWSKEVESRSLAMRLERSIKKLGAQRYLESSTELSIPPTAGRFQV